MTYEFNISLKKDTPWKSRRQEKAFSQEEKKKMKKSLWEIFKLCSRNSVAEFIDRVEQCFTCILGKGWGSRLTEQIERIKSVCFCVCLESASPKQHSVWSGKVLFSGTQINSFWHEWFSRTQCNGEKPTRGKKNLNSSSVLGWEERWSWALSQ